MKYRIAVTKTTSFTISAESSEAALTQARRLVQEPTAQDFGRDIQWKLGVPVDTGEPSQRCTECGEYWPCTLARRFRHYPKEVT